MTRAKRSASSGSRVSCRVDKPSSNVPSSVTLKTYAAHSPSSSPKRLNELLAVPDVEPSLDPLGVGIKCRSKAALSRLQLGHHEVGGLFGDTSPEGTSSRAPQMHGHPRKQGVVVQHFLEVGDDPVRVDAVPREAAAELVVHAAGSHGSHRALGHEQRISRSGACVMPDQELEHH